MVINFMWMYVFMWMVHGNDAARILGIFPTPSYSHQVTYRVVMKALASRGHQITVISPEPLQEQIENYIHIDVSFTKYHYQSKFDFATWDQTSPYDAVRQILVTLNKIMDDQLASPQIQQFIKISSNSSFDVVFMEAFISQSYHGLIHHLGSPSVIQIVSFECMALMSRLTGISSFPSFYPEMFFQLNDRMNFFERLQNTMLSLYIKYYVFVKYYNMQEIVMRKHFGSAPPSIQEAENNISMLMIARSPIFNYPVSLPPTAVTFHSLHIKRIPDPLSKDLQNFLDEATDGLIYFSLGTNVLSNQMPEEKIRIFIETFSELPQKVIWKWESDILPEKSPNVKTGKWLPQQDILAHKNVKLFITQCGLQSFQEAVYHGIPMLGIPFVADQGYNARKIQDLRIGLIRSFKDITKESLLQAIHEILNTTSFRENIRKVSALARDEPEDSLEKIIWWTEYVLRHKGAKHLRSAALDLQWYQYLLLDVAAFLLFITFIAIIVSYYFIKFILYCCFKHLK